MGHAVLNDVVESDADSGLRDRLIASNLFHLDFYKSKTGKDFSGIEQAAAHFVEASADPMLSAHPNFDPAYYLRTYSDIADVGVNPFLHYATNGFAEKRLASGLEEAYLLRLLRKADFFDHRHYSQRYEVTGDPFVHYLHRGYDARVEINRDYDGEFVATYYARTLSPYRRAFLMFSAFQGRHWCQFKSDPLLDVVQQIRTRGQFDEESYRTRYLDGNQDVDPILHYCTEGFRYLFDPNSEFSTEAYLSSYPDITKGELNPYGHFLNHGRKEGRHAAPRNLSQSLGHVRFDPSKPAILVVCHQASRTGAPLVGQMLAAQFLKTHNVVIWCGADGEILKDFDPYCVERVVCELTPGLCGQLFQQLDERYKFAAVVLNSAETWPILMPAVERQKFVVSLIHEFSEYARPRGRIGRMAALSDLVVVPCDLVRQSVVNDLKFIDAGEADDRFVVRHQGALPVRDGLSKVKAKRLTARVEQLMSDRGKTKLVVGCGHVQPRKGVDLFVQGCRLLEKQRSDTLYLWIGGGFDPTHDPHVSGLIEDAVNRSDLSDAMVFMDAVDDLEGIWTVADCLFLSSRLDPFPNVAIDALIRGVPVVCFDRATGICEMRESLPDLVLVADYLDAQQASERMQQALDLDDPAVLDTARTKALAVFDAAAYADEIASQIGEVDSTAGLSEYDRLRLGRLEQWDPPVSQGTLPPRRLKIADRLRSRKILSAPNPSPVSDANLQMGRREFSVFLEHFSPDQDLRPFLDCVSKLLYSNLVAQLNIVADRQSPEAEACIKAFGRRQISLVAPDSDENLVLNAAQEGLYDGVNDFVFLSGHAQFIKSIMPTLEMASCMSSDADVEEFLLTYQMPSVRPWNKAEKRDCRLEIYTSRYVERALLGTDRAISAVQLPAATEWGWLP